MESLRRRFTRVSVGAPAEVLVAAGRDDGWMGVEQAGRRMSFLADSTRGESNLALLESRFPGATIEIEEPSLRELFTTLAGRAGASTAVEMRA